MTTSSLDEPTAQQLLDPQVMDNRYPFYASLRDRAPVAPWIGDTGDTLLTRYADVTQVLRTRTSYKGSLSNAVPPWLGSGAAALLYRARLVTSDPPDHTRVRRALTRHFTPRNLDRLAADITHDTDQRLRQLAGNPDFDVISKFADLVPTTAICNLLGIATDDWSELTRYARDFVLIFSATPLTQAAAERCERACAHYLDYFGRLLAHKRQHPGDDVASFIVAAADTENAAIGDDELVATLESFLTAGYETTQTAIANGVLALADHPDQRARLVADPTLAAAATEEVLRWEAPLHFVWRYLAEPIEVTGVELDAGQRVQLCLAAANHDDRRFANADVFDITRADNAHLSFSAGAHHCLGSYLARIELSIALERLVNAFPQYEIYRPLPTRRRELTFPALPALILAP